MLQAGVIAVQGDVAEHTAAINQAADYHGEAVDVVEIRTAGIVPDCDLLLMPGGESTTIARLLTEEQVAEEITAFVADGKPLLATCAGLIVASEDANDARVETLNILDVSVARNAFGRQKDSFETSIAIQGLDDPFPAVFIRAPVVEEVGKDVEVLARVDDKPVAVRQHNVVGTAFHPELTNDPRVHELAFFSS